MAAAQPSRAPPLARNSLSGRARAGWVGRPDRSSRRKTSHGNPIPDHHDSVAMTPPPLHCTVHAGRKLYRSTLAIQFPLDHPAFCTLQNDFRRRCVMQGALRATLTGRVGWLRPTCCGATVTQSRLWLALALAQLTSLKTGYWPPKTSDELVRPREPIGQPY